jgi:hypothetical protein
MLAEELMAANDRALIASVIAACSLVLNSIETSAHPTEGNKSTIGSSRNSYQ